MTSRDRIACAANTAMEPSALMGSDAPRLIANVRRLKRQHMARRADSAPEFVKFIGPVITALRELGGSGRPDEVRTAIAKALNISQEE
jgi:hypothetical protein